MILEELVDQLHFDLLASHVILEQEAPTIRSKLAYRSLLVSDLGEQPAGVVTRRTSLQLSPEEQRIAKESYYETQKFRLFVQNHLDTLTNKKAMLHLLRVWRQRRYTLPSMVLLYHALCEVRVLKTNATMLCVLTHRHKNSKEKKIRCVLHHLKHLDSP